MEIPPQARSTIINKLNQVDDGCIGACYNPEHPNLFSCRFTEGQPPCPVIHQKTNAAHSCPVNPIPAPEELRNTINETFKIYGWRNQ